VVTHPSTNLAITGLSMGERTGSRVLRCLWSYVTEIQRGCVIANAALRLKEVVGLQMLCRVRMPLSGVYASTQQPVIAEQLFNGTSSGLILW
jgi:hypothetical protein